MIIDAHAHIRLDPGATGQSVDDLLTNMDAAKIDKAAVFASTISDLTTEMVIALTAKRRDRLFVVGAVSPTRKNFMPTPKTVDGWLADGTIRALKFYTGYEHFYPDDARLRGYMDVLQKYDRPAIFHSGDCYDKACGAKLKYAHPLRVDDLAAEMPKLKIVIAHLGSPWVTDAAQVCYKNENVYADCSGFVYGHFEPRQRKRFARVWREFDEVTESKGKILFGSDWPISDMRSYVETVEECIGKAPRSKVFQWNAEMLFGL